MINRKVFLNEIGTEIVTAELGDESYTTPLLSLCQTTEDGDDIHLILLRHEQIELLHYLQRVDAYLQGRADQQESIDRLPKRKSLPTKLKEETDVSSKPEEE